MSETPSLDYKLALGELVHQVFDDYRQSVPDANGTDFSMNPDYALAEGCEALLAENEVLREALRRIKSDTVHCEMRGIASQALVVAEPASEKARVR